MGHTHVDAEGNRVNWVDLARAFGFKTSTFAKILNCNPYDTRATVKVSDVADYLQSTEQFILALLKNEDRAISSDDVGHLLHMSRPTVIKNVETAAKLPQGSRHIMVYSQQKVQAMADKNKRGIELFGPLDGSEEEAPKVKRRHKPKK